MIRSWMSQKVSLTANFSSSLFRSLCPDIFPLSPGILSFIKPHRLLSGVVRSGFFGGQMMSELSWVRWPGNVVLRKSVTQSAWYARTPFCLKTADYCMFLARSSGREILWHFNVRHFITRISKEIWASKMVSGYGSADRGGLR